MGNMLGAGLKMCWEWAYTCQGWGLVLLGALLGPLEETGLGALRGVVWAAEGRSLGLLGIGLGNLGWGGGLGLLWMGLGTAGEGLVLGLC